MTDTLLVSTIDRQVVTFDLNSGDRTGGFRTSEADGGESVILNAISRICLDSKSMLIAGGSSADKSIRLYDLSGRLLARDYGHTESITGVVVITKPGNATAKTLVTAASDGTIFMWSLSGGHNRSHLDTGEEASMSGALQRTSSFHLEQAPVRRVVGSSEIARLRAAVAGPESPASVVHSRASGKHAVRPIPLQPQPLLQESDAKSPSTPSTPQGHRPLAAAHARRLHIRTVAATPSSPTTARHGSRRTPAPASANPAKSHTDGSTADGATLEDAVEETCTVLRKFTTRLARRPDGGSVDSTAISPDLVRELRREVAALEQALPRPSSLTDVDADASTAAGAHDGAAVLRGASTEDAARSAQLPQGNGEAAVV